MSWDVHWPLALPAQPRATLVTPERGTGRLKPGSFVQRKEQGYDFHSRQMQRQLVCCVWFDSGKEKGGVFCAHTFIRNRIQREGVGRGSVGSVGLMRVMWEDI